MDGVRAFNQLKRFIATLSMKSCMLELAMYVLPQFLCTFVLLICHTSHEACHSVYCLADPERNVTVFFPGPGSLIQRLACIKDSKIGPIVFKHLQMGNVR